MRVVKLTTTHRGIDKNDLARLVRPRSDIARERRDKLDLSRGHLAATFAQADGPFVDYERELRAERATPSEAAAHASGGASWNAIETFRYQLHVPYFRIVVAPLVRYSLRRPSRTGVSPLWAPPARFRPRHVQVLSALCVVVMAVGFWSNAPAELHTYAADEFDAGHLSQGLLGAVVRIGTLVAIGASVLADRRGRRFVLRLAVITNLFCSLATAVAPNLVAFTAVLTLNRTANAALAATVVVIALEEMPAGTRAWSLSVLALAGALGAGVVVWLQPIAGVAIWTWRLVFLTPWLAAPLLWLALRQTPETWRFASTYAQPRTESVDAGPPLLRYWRQVVLLGVVFATMGLFLGPLDWFRNEFLRDEHNFGATQVSLFILTTATPGGIGLYLAGRIADVRGRRRIIGAGAAVGLGAAALMFSVSGVWLWLLAVVATVTSAGLIPALGVYRGELFPTAVRARAGTVAAATGVVGGAVGIVTVGWLADAWGGFGPPMALLWIGPLVGATIAVTRLGEGARAELEQLHPVDARRAATTRYHA